MKPDKNIPRLVKIAVYTAPLIGILSITPIFIHRAVSINVFPRAVLIITLATFSVWSLNILLFYVSENKSLKQPAARIIRYVSSYAVSTVLIIFAARMLRLGLYSQTFTPDMTIRHFPYASSILGLSINTVILIIQDLIVLREKQAGIEIENANLKLKNTEALIEQLKQQIHPHFLFNSLNTLKSLIKKSPEAAEDYLVKLSDFLRVSMTGKENVVSIVDEMKLCIDFLEMQKIRYGCALKYTIDISDEQSKSGFIPAFALQLLIENAIKHNALTNEAPLHIDIRYDAGRIVVSNNFRKKATSESSSGLGLINLAERYRILSGDEILIKNSDDKFSVSVKILNHENSKTQNSCKVKCIQ